MVDPVNEKQLILGPFMGKVEDIQFMVVITSDTLLQVACQTIAFGQGVCGKAAQAKETIVVPVSARDYNTSTRC